MADCTMRTAEIVDETEEERTLDVLWNVFDCGGHLSDEELEALIESAELGAAYLLARREMLALTKTRMDLARLQDYKHARVYWSD